MISRLTALGIGALAMYFFDPVSGRRRRALVRDKMTHYHREATVYAESTAKDLRNRAQGIVAGTQKLVARNGSKATSKVDIDLSQPQ